MFSSVEGTIQLVFGEQRVVVVRSGIVIAEISTGHLPKTYFKCFRLEKLTEIYKYCVSWKFI